MMGKESRILIVDDHVVIRRLLRELIEKQSAWRICGEASTGKQAIRKAPVVRPDLTILDLHMPAMDGFQTTRELLTLVPDLRILILSADEELQFGTAAALSGARGYLAKSQLAGKLVEAVRTLLEGETYFDLSFKPTPIVVGLET
jgi:DNA-binding NarL/FixJ family response regulator